MAKILLVEDEPLTALDLKTRLARLGHDAEAPVPSGREALARARCDPPDLVLMDIGLPGPLDGVTTARALRECGDIPVVFLTGRSDDATVERACAVSPYGYVLKPVKDIDLEIAVDMALARHEIDGGRERLVRRLRESVERLRGLSAELSVCPSCGGPLEGGEDARVPGGGCSRGCSGLGNLDDTSRGHAPGGGRDGRR